MDVLEHFKYLPVYNLKFLGIDISITKLTMTLWFTTVTVISLTLWASRSLKMVPGFMQNIAESTILFIKNEMLFELPEQQKNRWLPFLLALFGLILGSNLVGLLPNMPAVSANINFTATLAIIVFIISQVNLFKNHGFFGFFRHLVPEGVPLFIIPLLLPIEILTQFARPFSLAVRLFANILAGHIIILLLLQLAVFLKSYTLGFLPVIGNVVISSFELFIGFIQAFIFTYLAANYIGEAEISNQKA